MTRGQSPRTVSIGGASGDAGTDRGQTTQDFAVGVGVFLLAMAFVFSFVPTFITPFDSAAGNADTTQADRIAATVVDDLSEDPDRPNHLNVTKLIEDEAYETDELATTLGVRSANGNLIDRVNVSIERMNGSVLESSGGDLLATGPTYDEDRPAASAARIVTADAEAVQSEAESDVAYRLVVRVW